MSNSKKFYANPDFQNAPNPTDLPLPLLKNPSVKKDKKPNADELKAMLNL